MIPRSTLARLIQSSCVPLMFVASALSPLAAADRTIAKARAIKAPRPEVPQIARARGLRGSGLFLCHVRPEDGTVWKVGILRSTGHKILDAAAVRSLAKWRFQPHTVRAVRIPINYTGNYRE